jgi:hypothetical protein
VLARRGGMPGLRLQAAELAGWRRVRLRGSRYPTLRRARGGRVAGALVDVPARAMARLAAYEGPRYRLTRQVVHDGRRAVPASVWVADAATSRGWP